VGATVYDFECVSGPLDGLTFHKTCLPPKFVWVGDRGGFYRKPRRGLALYRTHLSGAGVRLDYAELTHLRCAGCGSWHEHDENMPRCCLCNGLLVPPSWVRA
jgi:hypothetical protein